MSQTVSAICAGRREGTEDERRSAAPVRAGKALDGHVSMGSASLARKAVGRATTGDPSGRPIPLERGRPRPHTTQARSVGAGASRLLLNSCLAPQCGGAARRAGGGARAPKGCAETAALSSKSSPPRINGAYGCDSVYGPQVPRSSVLFTGSLNSEWPSTETAEARTPHLARFRALASPAAQKAVRPTDSPRRLPQCARLMEGRRRSGRSRTSTPSHASRADNGDAFHRGARDTT